MADAVLSFAVERLRDLLIQDAVFLHGVRDQVEQVRMELMMMKPFLRDADGKQGDERVRNWVAEIRDVAYDADDLIDTFILKIASRRRGGLQGVLKRYICIFTEWKDLHTVGKEIQVLKTRISDISNSRETYGVRIIGEEEGTSSANVQRQLRQSYPYDENFIGLEEETERLVAVLIEEEERRVISIVGMGGLGKTSLARKVYNHSKIRSHFDCRAWVFIYQKCRPRDILQEISTKFHISTNKEEMEDEELGQNIYKFLVKKRYLVVLDDVWNTEVWDILSPIFPNGKIGSKIMLTTRSAEVASHVDSRSFIHRPQCLTEEESWELFRKNAFPENTSCSPGLEKLGREMVKKCGGLPLAIAMLGGLLGTKKWLIEWEGVQNNISWHLNKGQLGVSETLALSYDDLPNQLKPCFLYLGIFPEDFEIPTRKLIQLWVAEGFLQLEGEETMEDVGELYLGELIDRSIVQIGRRSSTGRVKTCRVHCLMRDLCVLKAKETNFLEIFHHGNTAVHSSIQPLDKLRRHVIHFGHERYVSLEHSTPHLRTLVFFNLENASNLSLKFIYQDFKLMRVLDLQGVQVSKGRLPREIGKLLHLRYLGLRDTNIKELPTSIGNLQSLQTLNLRVCSRVLMIPNVIWKMQQLRHLHIYSGYRSDHLCIDTLRNLQTLQYIKAGNWIEDGLANLTNLRKLGIHRMSRSQVQVVLNSIVVRENCPLRSLYLKMSWWYLDGETFPDLEPLSRSHQLLKLYLDGRIDTEKLLQWPPNLIELTLVGSRLQQDPMATLQNLSNLKLLTLDIDSYIGFEMVCNAKGFPQLQVLKLEGLDELREWRVEEGAMPFLRHLVIDFCIDLRMVPEGLRFVITLQELKISRMPREFKDRVRGEGGEDWHNVQHIPSITIEDKRVK